MYVTYSMLYRPGVIPGEGTTGTSASVACNDVASYLHGYGKEVTYTAATIEL